MFNRILSVSFLAIFSLNLVAFSQTYSQKDLVASVILLEAGGEGQDGMQAVASVIQNRCRRDGLTPFEVVTKPKQFSCLNNLSHTQALNLATNKWPNQLSFAKQLTNQVYMDTLEDNTNGSYFYQRNECPIRKWHGRRTVVIGHHSFFKSNN